MGCRLSNFNIIGEWTTETIDGQKVEMVEAKYKPTKYRGKVYPSPLDKYPTWLCKINGVFQGATGSPDAVRHWAREKAKGVA